MDVRVGGFRFEIFGIHVWVDGWWVVRVLGDVLLGIAAASTVKIYWWCFQVVNFCWAA